MASNLVSALWLGAALVGLAVSSDPTKASAYDITVTPRFGDVGGTGVVSVDGNGGFNVTRLDVTMANGVNFDFPVLDHASAVINSEGDLVDLRARDVIPGDASLRNARPVGAFCRGPLFGKIHSRVLRIRHLIFQA